MCDDDTHVECETLSRIELGEMGKIEMVPAADALPAGLRLRAARDGPVKPLSDDVVEKTGEVVEEVVEGVKLLLWKDLRKSCALVFWCWDDD